MTTRRFLAVLVVACLVLAASGQDVKPTLPPEPISPGPTGVSPSVPVYVRQADNQWVPVVTAGLAGLGTMFSAVMAYLLVRLNSENALRTVAETNRAHEAAMHVEMLRVEQKAQVGEVKTTLEKAGTETSEKLEQLHRMAGDQKKWASSNMRIQLELMAKLARSIADRDRDPHGIAVAEIAEESLRRYDEQEQKADERESD